MATKIKSQKQNGAAPETEESVPRISLTRLERKVIEVPIRGITPVMPHKWSEKALGLMRIAQSGTKNRVKAQPGPKIAHEEAEAATYYLPDGTPGIPASAFKAAIVGACRNFDGITMTHAKNLIGVRGIGTDQLLPLIGERFVREDTPRNANGSADLRYRYAYWPWETVLPIWFLASQIDVESVLALVDGAGMGGVGDWRPSSPKSATGTFGQFEVDAERELRLVG